jgi:hypothetical protein
MPCFSLALAAKYARQNELSREQAAEYQVMLNYILKHQATGN